MHRAPLLALLAALAARPASAYTPAEAKAPMTATLVRSDAKDCGADCPEWLALTGAIGPGTPALFRSALARLGRHDIPVLVDSPGGSVRDAMAIGRLIRARRLAVAVAGTSLSDCSAADRSCAARRRAGERSGFVAGGPAACASACVLILAAGAERSVGPGSYVGVHQMVVHKTLTRVLNHFLIIRRMVRGRPVEVSRTLVRTEPLSSRLVVTAASDALYSEVDRYLLGLGIAESIMPLMRSAPPSGIHWMTPSELAATRLATDTSEPRSLLARLEPPRPSPPQRAPTAAAAAKPAVPSVMGLAAAVLGDGRRTGGIVDWHVEDVAGQPTLVGAVDIPERGLRGGLAIGRDDKAGAGGGAVATVDLGTPSAIQKGRVWTSGAPVLCDAAACDGPFTTAAESDDGRGGRTFRAPAPRRGILLSSLESRGWILIPLSAGDGAKGWVSLAIDGGIRAVVDAWEHLCCGVAATIAVAPIPSGSVDGSAVAAWTALPEAAAPRPGITALLGDIAIPSARLDLAVEAEISARGGIVLTVHVRAEGGAFGPVETIRVDPIVAADGHTALVGAAHRRADGTFVVALTPAGPMPAGAKLGLAVVDAGGREMSAAVPLSDAIARLLAASTPAEAARPADLPAAATPRAARG